MAISKIILNGVTQIDLTQDTVSANSDVMSPKTFHKPDGTTGTGSISTGTEGTPIATKSAVSNNSVTVTPSVTNTAGVITGGTHTGSAVTVTASELVTATRNITTNATGYDVRNYAYVNVAVPVPSVTQDANGYVVLPKVTGGANANKLTYETGLFIPPEDVISTWINFSRYYPVPPYFYSITDITGTYDSTTDSNYYLSYENFHRLTGETISLDNGTTNIYGIVQFRYRSSATALSATVINLYYADDYVPETINNTYPNYWARITGIRAKTNSAGTYYWRAGRTYKWIAIWPPNV